MSSSRFSWRVAVHHVLNDQDRALPDDAQAEIELGGGAKPDHGHSTDLASPATMLSLGKNPVRRIRSNQHQEVEQGREIPSGA